jgi:hypothetical protein
MERPNPAVQNRLPRLRLVELDANRGPPIEMDGGRSLPASDAGDEPQRAADDLRAGQL